MTAAGAGKLGAALLCNSRLRELDLSQCQLDDECMERLCDVVMSKVR
jgi:hypothetical protein